METALSISSDIFWSLTYGGCDAFGSTSVDGYLAPGETDVNLVLHVGEFPQATNKTICDSVWLLGECDRVASVDTSHIFLFALLLEQWHRERGIMSSLSDIVECPSYLRIVGMGRKALPLILAQMKKEGDDPDYWFDALEAIAGVDPIPQEADGDPVKMAQAWFDWAHSNDVW